MMTAAANKMLFCDQIQNTKYMIRNTTTKYNYKIQNTNTKYKIQKEEEKKQMLNILTICNKTNMINKFKSKDDSGCTENADNLFGIKI